MKKTRIGLVFGGGAMYVKENNYQFYELIAGLERNFKLTRRRLRIGVYGFASDGNKMDTKIADEIIDFLVDPKHKWTLVVSSKNEYWKKQCSRTIELSNGKLIADSKTQNHA